MRQQAEGHSSALSAVLHLAVGDMRTHLGCARDGLAAADVMAELLSCCNSSISLCLSVGGYIRLGRERMQSGACPGACSE